MNGWEEVGATIVSWSHKQNDKVPLAITAIKST